MKFTPELIAEIEARAAAGQRAIEGFLLTPSVNGYLISCAELPYLMGPFTTPEAAMLAADFAVAERVRVMRETPAPEAAPTIST